MTNAVDAALAAIRKRKRHDPHCFPEYMELLQAKAARRAATERLKNARNAWHQLGKPPKPRQE